MLCIDSSVESRLSGGFILQVRLLEALKSRPMPIPSIDELAARYGPRSAGPRWDEMETTVQTQKGRRGAAHKRTRTGNVLPSEAKRGRKPPPPPRTKTIRKSYHEDEQHCSAGNCLGPVGNGSIHFQGKTSDVGCAVRQI